MPRFDGMGPVGVPEELTIRRRRLPHWQAGGSTYFVTFRSRGTLRRRAAPARDGRQAQPGPLSTQERQIVRASVLHWHPGKWRVHLLTVMPDHVHVLATPQQSAPAQCYSLSEILHSVKRH
jgi:REP element-mobilizing transposase RayT